MEKKLSTKHKPFVKHTKRSSASACRTLGQISEETDNNQAAFNASLEALKNAGELAEVTEVAKSKVDGKEEKINPMDTIAQCIAKFEAGKAKENADHKSTKAKVMVDLRSNLFGSSTRALTKDDATACTAEIR